MILGVFVATILAPLLLIYLALPESVYTLRALHIESWSLRTVDWDREEVRSGEERIDELRRRVYVPNTS